MCTQDAAGICRPGHVGDGLCTAEIPRDGQPFSCTGLAMLLICLLIRLCSPLYTFTQKLGKWHGYTNTNQRRAQDVDLKDVLLMGRHIRAWGPGLAVNAFHVNALKLVVREGRLRCLCACSHHMRHRRTPSTCKYKLGLLPTLQTTSKASMSDKKHGNCLNLGRLISLCWLEHVRWGGLAAGCREGNSLSSALLCAASSCTLASSAAFCSCCC